METLDKGAIARIFEKVSAAIKEVNLSGVEPSEAIAKQASAAGYSPEVACRMCEAYNVSRALKAYQGSSGIEKLSAFPLADPGKVVDLMYPSKVSLPDVQQQKAASLISIETESRSYLSHVFTPVAGGLEKVASTEKSFDGSLCGRVDGNMAAAPVLHALRSLGEYIKEAELSVAGGEYDLFDDVLKFANYFRRTDAVPFERVDAVVRGAWGPAAKGVMDVVEGVCKQAGLALLRASGPDACFAPDEAPYSDVRNLLSKRAELAVRRETVEKAKQSRAGMQEKLRSLFQKESSAGTSLLLLDRLRQEVGDRRAAAPGAAAPAKQRNAVLEQLAAPEYDAKRQALRAQLMLQQLMNDDEVISQYGPDRVVEAFNRLSTVSPQVALNSEIARAGLRKILEGELDVLDSDSFVGLETALTQLPHYVNKSAPGVSVPGIEPDMDVRAGNF